MSDNNKSSSAPEESKGFKVYLHAITNKQNLLNWGGTFTDLKMKMKMKMKMKLET